MPGTPKHTYTRDAYRQMWRAVRSFLGNDESEYQHVMDGLTNDLTESEWLEALRWIEIAERMYKADPSTALAEARAKFKPYL